MIPSLHALTHVLRATTLVPLPPACPAEPQCPGNDLCSITYPENSVINQVTCANNLYGEDLGSPFQIATLTGCSRQCSRTTGCVAAAYEGLNCYLKTTISGKPYPKTSVVGIALFSGTPKSFSPKICPPNFSCPEDDGCSTTDGTRWLKLECGADYVGGDINPGVEAASIEACSKICLNTPECVAMSFVGGKAKGNCYTKRTQGPTQFTDHNDGLYLSEAPNSSPNPTTPGAPVTTPLVCDGDDGKTFVAGSKTFLMQCGINFEGNDLDAVDVAPRDLTACITECANRLTCQSVALDNARCYLKYGIGAPLKSGVLGAKLLPPSTPGPTTPSPGPPVTTPLVCNGDDGTTFVASSKTFLVRCNVDYTGADIRGVPNTAGDLNTCINVCAKEPNCQSVVLNGGECFLKSTIGVRKTGPGALGAELLPSPSICAVPGKVARGITYTDIKEPDLTKCKTQCQTYSLAGLKCRVFGRNPTTGLCTLSLGSTAPTFDKAFEPSQSSGQFWTIKPESKQYWYGDDCLI